jgi:hypothetical protein
MPSPEPTRQCAHRGGERDRCVPARGAFPKATLAGDPMRGTEWMVAVTSDTDTRSAGVPHSTRYVAVSLTL